MSLPVVPSVLDSIIAAAWKRVEVARERRSLADLERAIADEASDVDNLEFRMLSTPSRLQPMVRLTRLGPASWPTVRPTWAVLRQRALRSWRRCSSQASASSPNASAGRPRRACCAPHYDPVAIAGQYATAGAAAISILTEPGFFDGALDHLVAVHAAHPDVPLLRKDFTVDEYQIAEAALAGASAVLLIVAALEQPVLVRLLAYAAQAGIDVLTEVHDENEAHRAMDAGATIIGVNNRNLKTLDGVDRYRASRGADHRVGACARGRERLADRRGSGVAARSRIWRVPHR